MANREQKVRDRAYQLWIEEGQPHGRSDDHWRRARELVDAEDSAEPGDDGGPIGADPAAGAEAAARKGGTRRPKTSR